MKKRSWFTPTENTVKFRAKALAFKLHNTAKAFYREDTVKMFGLQNQALPYYHSSGVRRLAY